MGASSLVFLEESCLETIFLNLFKYNKPSFVAKKTKIAVAKAFFLRNFWSIVSRIDEDLRKFFKNLSMGTTSYIPSEFAKIRIKCKVLRFSNCQLST